MIFGQRLKQVREGELSQGQLAELLNVHNNTISKWENGEQEPRSQRVAKLASILNTTTAYLLGETNFSELSNNNEITHIHPDEQHNMFIIQEGERKYFIPNDEEGRRIFMSILTSGLSGKNPPLVSNAINGGNNSGNNLGVVDN